MKPKQREDKCELCESGVEHIGPYCHNYSGHIKKYNPSKDMKPKQRELGHLPSIIEAIKFRMEQYGHTQKDLAKLLGSRSRASELLSGKRGASKDMMKKLYEYGIPASVLFQTKAWSYLDKKEQL